MHRPERARPPATPADLTRLSSAPALTSKPSYLTPHDKTTRIREPAPEMQNLPQKLSRAKWRGCLHLTPGGVSCQVQRRCVSASQASRPQPTTGSSLPTFPIFPPDCCSCGTQPQAPHTSKGFANLRQRPPHTKFSFPICTIQPHLMNPQCCSTIITISFQNISISPKGNLVPKAASPFPLVLDPGNHQSAFGLPYSHYSGISQK